MKKIDGDYKTLITKPFTWSTGKDYIFRIGAKGNIFTFIIDDIQVIEFVDEDFPYLTGQVGLSNGSKCSTRFIDFEVKPVNQS